MFRFVPICSVFLRFVQEASDGRQEQLLPSSLRALDATSKVRFPQWERETRQHECNKDVASDVCWSCSCCPWAGADCLQNKSEQIWEIPFCRPLLQIPDPIQKFRKGVGGQRGLARAVPEIQTSFCALFPMPPLGKGNTILGSIFAVFWRPFVANPFPPTPFRHL